MTASVSLADIRSWFNQTFDLLEQAGCDRFDLKPAHYWQVYFSDAFDHDHIDESRPPKPVIGTLENDIEELQHELSKVDTEIGAAPWHILDHLGPFVALMASQTPGIFVSRK